MNNEHIYAECDGTEDDCPECYKHYMANIHPDFCDAICCLGEENSCEECEDFSDIGGVKKDSVFSPDITEKEAS